MIARTIASVLAVAAFGAVAAPANPADVLIDTPMAPPAWALLERQLLKAHTPACREFFQRYFDDRGFLLCVERWGGDDGPDDAIENCNDWPLLHALGGSDEVRAMYRKAWEGHLRQFTLAKTVEVPLARDGMYYKEFPTQMDWLHNGEGLNVFNNMGLSDGLDPAVVRRMTRYAGFYLNDDPGAPNYDPDKKLIRSMFNGSRGPLLRKATGLDWAGDPIEVANRFKLGHGERSYAEMVAHFKDYNDVIGDHPLNLLSTCLAVNSYALTGETRYRDWVLEYVGAWRERMAANNDLIPTNVGLDGKAGSNAGNKWYGGVYGWGFTVVDPVTNKPVHRNQHQAGVAGFMNAYMLTGDDRWLEPWRKQADHVNAQGKRIDGKMKYPRMFGDQGWYDWADEKYTHGSADIYLLSQKASDRARTPDTPWLRFLEGKNPGYPEDALRGDLDQIRRRVAAMRTDTTTPDTRLADDPMKYNPAAVDGLLQLTTGGIHPLRSGALLHARLRYWDPEHRRAGLPEDVAALVEKMDSEHTTLTLVNVSPTDSRTVTVQGGAYGEHRFSLAAVGDRSAVLNGSSFTVHMEPGSGARLNLTMKRHVNPPTLLPPWKR